MKIKKIQVLVFFLVFSAFLSFFITLSADETKNSLTLRDLIEQKAEELSKIQRQREDAQKELEEVSQSRRTLSNEISIINSNINQLNLSIKENELNLERLALEIESLNQDIVHIQKSIENTRETLARFLFELNHKSKEGMLILFLKNTTLSESVSEINNITTLQNSLRESLVALRSLSIELANKLEQTKNNKLSREIENQNLANRRIILNDQNFNRQTLLTETRNQEVIYQRQLSELEKLQREIDAEIGRIEEVLRKEIDPNLLPIPRFGVLNFPIQPTSAGAWLTQCYGRTPFAVRTYPSQHHNGIDIGAPIGTPIYAAEAGIVLLASDQDSYRGCRGGAYGKVVTIKHNNGLTTLYAHLSRFTVSAGQSVRRGEVIGYVGNSGWSTGPHLHFTVFASQTLTPARPGLPEGTQASRVCGPMPVGGDINPALYIDLREYRLAYPQNCPGL